MKNKKAQSEVITTVLIILLVLAAVFIVYTAVMSMIRGGTTTVSEKSKCMGLDMQVNSASGTSVVVQRNAGGDEGDVTPVILVGGQVVGVTECTPNAALGSLETTTCTLTTALTADVSKVKVGGKYGETSCEFVSSEFTATAVVP